MPYANLNLEGRLVNDPEFKQGKDNHEFCTFRVAVNQWHGDQEQASFFNCTGGEAMSGRIKKAGMKKGRMVHITGDLVLRDYQTRDGQTRTSADVSIQNWHFVGPKPKDEDAGAPQANAAPAQQGTAYPDQYIGDDDDLPV